MSSPVQNGKVNRIQFFDGEGLAHEDFNAITAGNQAYVGDLVLGTMMKMNGLSVGPEAPSAAQLYALGHSGAPIGTATARTYGCKAGPLFYVAPGLTIDGLTPKVLSYYVNANEITGQLAVGDATFPRFDAVYIKISEVDGPTVQRDFTDAVTGVVTSQLVATTRQTKLEWTVVQGTPAAKPLIPAAPDSTWARWGVWYVPKGWSSGTLLWEFLFDYRIPVGYRRYALDVKQMYAVYPSGTTTATLNAYDGYAGNTSGDGFGTVAANCPVRHGRVMSFGWSFVAGGPGTGKSQLYVRHPVGGTTNVADPPWNTTIYGGIRSGDPTMPTGDMDNFTMKGGVWYNANGDAIETSTSGFQLLPIWANGRGSEAMDDLQNVYTLLCFWVPTLTTCKLIAWNVDIAGS